MRAEGLTSQSLARACLGQLSSFQTLPCPALAATHFLIFFGAAASLGAAAAAPPAENRQKLAPAQPWEPAPLEGLTEARREAWEEGSEPCLLASHWVSSAAF